MQVFIAGDSTAAEWGPEFYPQFGWGMVLKCAFDDGVTVRNYARSGRSSKSFIEEGQFARIEREMKAGDTLLIQFGHNDQKVGDPSRELNLPVSKRIQASRPGLTRNTTLGGPRCS